MVKYFSSAPIVSGSLLVDTNVLLWTFYGKYGFSATPYQNTYLNFLANTLSNGTPVYTTSLNLSELFHIIEVTEFKFYCLSNSIHITPQNRTFELKKFRANPTENAKLKKNLIMCTIKSPNKYTY